MPPVRGRELKLAVLDCVSIRCPMPPVRGRELKQTDTVRVHTDSSMPPVRGRELKLLAEVPNDAIVTCPLCGGEN